MDEIRNVRDNIMNLATVLKLVPEDLPGEDVGAEENGFNVRERRLSYQG